MKKLMIVAGVLLVVFLLNSCSCEQWFNNGCPWNETWLGSGFAEDPVDDGGGE